MSVTHRGVSPRKFSVLVTAFWFGVVAGLIEGLLLLAFQRINWQQWGRGIHVSSEILWISPLVDTVFFLLIASAVALVGRFIPRLPGFRVVVFLLTFLSVYDWLALTNRLYRRSCLLLALGIATAFIRWIKKRESAATVLVRKSIWWIFAAFVLTFSGIQGGKWLHERVATADLAVAAPGSPNVLVIVIDTLRADHVSSYGYSRATTPEIDRLAAQGVLFENAIAPCSWSLPSHASLLTGRYPFDHGMVNVQPMPWLGWGKSSLRGYPTLGEALQRNGYRTGAFSANRTFFTRDVGLGRGFIHFEDYFHSPADAFLRTLYGREFTRFYLYRSNNSKVTRALRYLGMDSLFDKDSEGSFDAGGAHRVRKRAGEVNRETLRWIDRDRQRPFLAVLNYFDVHDPYGSPDSYLKPSGSKKTDIDAYDDGLKYVDDSIADLMRELESRGLAKNTLVVITSDHGEALGAHGLTFHGAALYWEQVHVPLVIWYPGHVPEGLRIARPVSNAALPATIMDVLSANNPFPGPPLTALWKNPATTSSWPGPLSELAQTNIILTPDKRAQGKIPIATDGDMNSLITPRWHLIVHKKWRAQLYDWTVDPAESNNVVDNPEGRSVARDLDRLLKVLSRPSAN